MDWKKWFLWTSRSKWDIRILGNLFGLVRFLRIFRDKWNIRFLRNV